MESVDRTCQMRFCVNCNDDKVYPFDWYEDGPKHWIVLLRCGNCDMFHEDRFHQDEVEDFDCWLDDCTDEIQAEADRLTRLNMSDEADAFKRMLELDLITPEDF